MPIDVQDEGPFAQALRTVEPGLRETLHALIRDTSYVEPRVVSHRRD